MTAFLATNNTDYIRMFLSIMYSNYISDVDEIYKGINDPAISMHVKLASLIIHTKPIETLAFKNGGQNNYMRSVNQYFSQYYSQSNSTVSSCDHVFFIVNKGLNANVLGLAYVKGVCRSSQFTSLILNSFQARLDQILAHELAHSLGALHDNESHLRKKRLDELYCSYKAILNSTMLIIILKLNFSIENFTPYQI